MYHEDTLLTNCSSNLSEQMGAHGGLGGLGAALELGPQMTVS